MLIHIYKKRSGVQGVTGSEAEIRSDRHKKTPRTGSDSPRKECIDTVVKWSECADRAEWMVFIQRSMHSSLRRLPRPFWFFLWQRCLCKAWSLRIWARYGGEFYHLLGDPGLVLTTRPE